MRHVLGMVVLLCLAAMPLAAQDPAKVDPKHYKVEFENAQVRVLRFHYAPHEKSVMHSHPNLVVIALSDSKVRFTLPDGKSEERQLKAHEANWTEATIHNPENIGDTPADGILVEIKAKAPPAAPKK